MNVSDAKSLVNSMSTKDLSKCNIKMINTVVIPVSITRKQVAAGFIYEKYSVDIYITKSTISEYNLDNEENVNDSLNATNNSSDNTTIPTVNPSTNDIKIVGGYRVVSFLRSKNADSIDANYNNLNSNNNISHNVT